MHLNAFKPHLSDQYSHTIMPKKDIKKEDKSVTKTTKKQVAALGVKEEKEEESKKIDDFIRAVGRRKSAAARVRLYPNGSGKIEINGKDYKQYFPLFELNKKITLPLKLVGRRNDFNFTIKVAGGGPVGQADACSHGITRALIKFNEDYKKTLRAAGFVTRDPRVKERKKYGLKKARRAPQWQKR